MAVLIARHRKISEFFLLHAPSTVAVALSRLIAATSPPPLGLSVGRLVAMAQAGSTTLQFTGLIIMTHSKASRHRQTYASVRPAGAALTL